METKKISQSKDFKQRLKRKKYRYISLTTIGCLLFMGVGTGIGYGIFNKGSTSPTPSVDYKIHDVTVNKESGNTWDNTTKTLIINQNNNTILSFGAYGKTECAQFNYDSAAGKLETKSTYFYAATHPYYFYNDDELLWLLSNHKITAAEYKTYSSWHAYYIKGDDTNDLSPEARVLNEYISNTMLDLQNYQSGVYKIYEFPNSYVCQFHDVEAPQSTYILGSEYSEIYEFTLVNNVLN